MVQSIGNYHLFTLSFEAILRIPIELNSLSFRNPSVQLSPSSLALCFCAAEQAFCISF